VGGAEGYCTVRSFRICPLH